MRRILLGILVSFVVIVVVSVVFLEATYRRDFSSTPLPNIIASTEPDVIARGEYVVHAVAHCSACHGTKEAAQARRLPDDKHDLSGGVMMSAGPFGTYYPANLTSDEETGLGALSDGVVARSIRSGVDRHGHIAPFMRLTVGPMSDEDLTAVVSYLRTLPAKKNAVPADEWGFLAKLLSSSFAPRNASDAASAPVHVAAAAEPTVERGAYLANGPAACAVCHTPTDPFNGFAAAGAKFSGEPQAEPDVVDPAYEIVAPNLTPDVETGHITSWSEDQFVARFQSGAYLPGTKMPWPSFAQITDNDLRSIHRYLRSLPPAKNAVGPTRRLAGSYEPPRAQ